MSQAIKDSQLGNNVVINDVGGGQIRIGFYTFHYSTLLPVLLHYICGGIFGFPLINKNSDEMDRCVNIPIDEWNAIQDFIRDVKDLIPVRRIDDRIAMALGNHCLVPKKEYENGRQYYELVNPE